MSSVTEKTREQILAERQEKKKNKANLKNKSKEKIKQTKNIQNCTLESKSLNSTSAADHENDKNEDQIANKLIKSTKQCTLSEPGHKTVSSVLMTEAKNEFLNNESFSLQPSVCAEKLTGIGQEINKNEEVKTQFETAKVATTDVTKTKAQLKAERRAKQEADRARKIEKTSTSSQKLKAESPSKPIQPVKTIKIPQVSSHVSHKVKLFAHLYDALPNSDTVDSPSNIHPSIIQLKTQYSSRVVSGANASCLALLNALKKVVLDFETPINQEFSRGLESEITKCMSYLNQYRHVAVSMMNAVKHLKFKVNQSKGNELECKNNIIDWIDTYIKEQLEMAAKAICLFVREKISSGDVILTYGWSSLIHQILISVHNEGIRFKVIVADGRPWLEGREMLKKLVSAGIQCTYVFVNGLSFIMPEVTKILLGAHALLANGYVMSRVGSSQVALLAKTYNVPVLVCCETHKFSERVQTDSFVYNELGNPDDLASNKGCISKELSKWKTIHYLTPLNLMYDVTPPDLVTAVVTEIAVLPCTSVPVILRIKPPDLIF